MAIQTKAQRIAELEAVLQLVHKDLLQRGTKEEDGGIVVDVGAGVWYRLCQTLKSGQGNAKGKDQDKGVIPEHHKQWFNQLKLAAANGDLALMLCHDINSMEPRSVITLVGRQDGDIIMTPVGHLCPEDNPYEAYLPPRTETERTVQ